MLVPAIFREKLEWRDQKEKRYFLTCTHYIHFWCTSLTLGDITVNLDFFFTFSNNIIRVKQETLDHLVLLEIQDHR